MILVTELTRWGRSARFAARSLTCFRFVSSPLVDTRLEISGESIGTVVSTHDTIAAAFKGNEAFQIRMREAGSKSYIRKKIVTLKVQLAQVEKVQPEHLD